MKLLGLTTRQLIPHMSSLLFWYDLPLVQVQEFGSLLSSFYRAVYNISLLIIVRKPTAEILFPDQDACVRPSKFASHFSIQAVTACPTRSPLITEQLQTTPASFPQEMTTDLYWTVSDHVLLCRLTVINGMVPDILLHIYMYMHIICCCNICTAVNTMQILLSNVTAAQNPLSVPLSNVDFKSCSFGVF